jgi:hypothetical protein
MLIEEKTNVENLSQLFLGYYFFCECNNCVLNLI